jgi:hypothetical protein
MNRGEQLIDALCNGGTQGAATNPFEDEDDDEYEHDCSGRCFTVVPGVVGVPGAHGVAKGVVYLRRMN